MINNVDRNEVCHDQFHCGLFFTVHVNLARSTIERAGDKQKVTIMGISRRCSTIDQDSLDQSRSAPSSPAQSRYLKRRLSTNRSAGEPNENVS